jgi:hypothetical protein
VRAVIEQPEKVLRHQGSEANVDTGDCWKVK